VVYNGGGIPIYWFPDKEIPPWEERPLPSILSLLPPMTKTEGKAVQVAVTPLAWTNHM
jgi:hypothetical protein